MNRNIANNNDDRKKINNPGEDQLRGNRDLTDAAREEAMGDIAEDADLSIHHPNDDLDEGETARLGEDKTDLV